MTSKLVWLIGEVESNNNPVASLVDYKGNISENAQYQQSCAYILEWGDGAVGIENQANEILRTHSNATIGDFYSAYNHGSILPWSVYSARFPLQAHNFLAKAKAMGYDQTAPLKTLLDLEV